ncbi:MAG: hypothetical protein AB8H03_05960 [Saprospiraceae bacterium]
MKSKLTFFVLCTILFFSCKKDNEINIDKDCFKSYFEMHNFVRFTGQPSNCQDYAILFLYKGQFYFERQNFCERWAAIFETCEGVRIDQDDSLIDFSDFRINAESKGIFGIEDK